MTGQLMVFIAVAVATGFAAVMTVTSKNLVHAAMFLAATLAGTAAVFLVLHADLLGLVQLLVYVGAIAVLFLFGLMLTRAPIGREALDSQNRGLALAVSGTLFLVLGTLIVQTFGDAEASQLAGAGIADIGLAIFSSWVLPFELLSMLLLAALVGAIVLSRRSSGESGHELEPTRLELGETPSIETDRPELPAGQSDPREENVGTTPGGQP